MKIKTIFTPQDTEGNDVNFRNLFTLADLEKLGQDLANAGVEDGDALDFVVDAQGLLTITHFQVL